MFAGRCANGSDVGFFDNGPNMARAYQLAALFTTLAYLDPVRHGAPSLLTNSQDYATVFGIFALNEPLIASHADNYRIYQQQFVRIVRATEYALGVQVRSSWASRADGHSATGPSFRSAKSSTARRPRSARLSRPWRPPRSSRTTICAQRCRTRTNSSPSSSLSKASAIRGRSDGFVDGRAGRERSVSSGATYRGTSSSRARRPTIPTATTASAAARSDRRCRSDCPARRRRDRLHLRRIEERVSPSVRRSNRDELTDQA